MGGDNKDAKKLLAQIAYMRSSEQFNLLWEQFEKVLIKHDIDEALFTTLTGCDPKSSWLLMQVDLRDAGEVEWQAQALAKTHGIADSFQCGTLERAEDKVLEALVQFNAWLKNYNFNYVVWDTDSDEHRGFIFPKDKTAGFLRLAKKVGLHCTTLNAREKSDTTAAKRLAAYKKLMDNYSLKKADEDIDGFSLEDIAKSSDEALHDLISAAVHRANSIGYKPFLYIGAPGWCEPCRDFVLAIDTKIFATALAGVCLVMVDLDTWPLEDIKIKPITSIPILVALDEAGLPVGEIKDFSFTGDADNTPPLLAEGLKPFFMA